MPNKINGNSYMIQIASYNYFLAVTANVPLINEEMLPLFKQLAALNTIFHQT